MRRGGNKRATKIVQTVQRVASADANKVSSKNVVLYFVDAKFGKQLLIRFCFRIAGRQ